MSINDLIYTNAHNAYEQGLKTERERIISALRNQKIAETLIVLAENTKPEHPKEIQNHAWSRIAVILEGDQK